MDACFYWLLLSDEIFLEKRQDQHNVDVIYLVQLCFMGPILQSRHRLISSDSPNCRTQLQCSPGFLCEVGLSLVSNHSIGLAFITNLLSTKWLKCKVAVLNCDLKWNALSHFIYQFKSWYETETAAVRIDNANWMQPFVCGSERWYADTET